MAPTASVTTAETAPLLREHEQDAHASSEAPKKDTASFRILLIMMAAILVLEASDGLIDSPMTRIMEAVSCYRYYDHADPTKLLAPPDQAGPGAIYGTNESMCKILDVQREVALIRSWQFFFEGIPALALAVPFAWLQDRYGRRPFIVLGMVSLVLRGAWIMLVLWFWRSFSLEWTWISSLHALMMGGQPVVSSLFFTMITDITTEAERATAFMRVSAMVLLMAFAVPPATAVLMSYNPWLPVFLGAFVCLVGLGLMCTVPETLDFRKDPLAEHDNSQADTGIEQVCRDFLTAFSFLWADIRLIFLLSLFLLNSLGSSGLVLLVQYASTRYHLSIAQATLLISVRCGVTFLLLFAIIPMASDLLISKLSVSVKKKDLIVTRISFSIMAVGWTLIGLSPTAWLFIPSLVVETFGAGALHTLRSLLTALVPPQHIALAYSVTSIADTLGSMFGAPLLAECFSTGLNAGGYAMGLPFYLLGGLCFVFAIVLLAVRLRKDEEGSPS